MREGKAEKVQAGPPGEATALSSLCCPGTKLLWASPGAHWPVSGFPRLRAPGTGEEPGVGRVVNTGWGGARGGGLNLSPFGRLEGGAWAEGDP